MHDNRFSKCFCCGAGHGLMPRAFFLVDICQRCYDKIERPETERISECCIDDRIEGREKFPSVYGPIEAKWTRLENKKIRRDRLLGADRMTVSIAWSDGTDTAEPLTKAEQTDQLKKIRKDRHARAKAARERGHSSR